MHLAIVGQGRVRSGCECEANPNIGLFEHFSQVDEIAAIESKGFEK
jgi:hypothetical protein